ncbi:hypothetical protein ACLOJK_034556 [Asimina triloba]
MVGCGNWIWLWMAVLLGDSLPLALVSGEDAIVSYQEEVLGPSNMEVTRELLPFVAQGKHSTAKQLEDSERCCLLIACGIAVATYNEGATDFKETPAYKESTQTRELLDEPEASSSDVFEGNPTEAAPSLE